MKAPDMRKAAGPGSAGGFELQVLQQANSTASAEINKWLAVWCYSHGYLSHSGCEAAFRVHPEWRAA
jgi:hypothetical protein